MEYLCDILTGRVPVEVERCTRWSLETQQTTEVVVSGRRNPNILSSWRISNLSLPCNSLEFEQGSHELIHRVFQILKGHLKSLELSLRRCRCTEAVGYEQHAKHALEQFHVAHRQSVKDWRTPAIF